MASSTQVSRPIPNAFKALTIHSPPLSLWVCHSYSLSLSFSLSLWKHVLCKFQCKRSRKWQLTNKRHKWPIGRRDSLLSTFLNFVIWFSLFQKLNCVIQRWRHTILYRRKNLTRSPPTALAQVTVVFLFENFDARHLLSTSISRWFSTKKFFTFFYNVPPYSSSFLYIKVSVQMLISLPHLQSNYLIQQFVVL